MVLGITDVSLGNPLGWYGLLSLIPFILIYLIRPRPKKMEIPSLMFFLTFLYAAKNKSFFRNFAKDWLFLIHLLALLLLTFALLRPITTYEHDITAANTVVVIDVSASSQTAEGSGTRFSHGVSKAIESLGEKNTIILAKSVPKLLIQDAGYDDAVQALRGLTPTESPSAIGEAIVLAGEVLAGKEGRVVVISDFINTGGLDPDTARNVLSTKGIVVDFIDTATGTYRKNVGIIDMEIDEKTVTLFIRNFNDQDETVGLTIGTLSKQIALKAKTTETFSFNTPVGSVQIDIDVNDDFPVDNKAFLSVPENQDVSVLLISNNVSPFLKNAITSSPLVSLDIAEPPIVPNADYDVYVIHGIDPQQLLPGTFEAIEERVRNGRAVVIGAQEEMGRIDYAGLLPLTIIGDGGSDVVVLDQINRFTKHMGTNIGSVKRYFKTSLKPGAASIASIQNSSLLAFQQQGLGKLFYYGILESASDFKYDPDYPIFWVKLVEFLTNQEKIENINVKTGESSILDGISTIKTPRRTLEQNVVLYEEAGIYRINDRKVSSNLLNQQESTINAVDTEVTAVDTQKEVELKPVTEQREFSFVTACLIILAVLLLVELIYVKLRGDF